MSEDIRSASQSELAPNFPRYSAAVTGFRHYWYPVMFGRDLRRPRRVRLCGENIALFRDGGRLYALEDRCPHRGIPLSVGRQEFPCTVSCIYHGWTFNLATGKLVAVLTDGPESPICGKANVRTYPVEERAGLIWVYVGDAPAPPVEQDIPAELLRPDTVLEGVVQRRRGNWRYAAENGIDEGHSKFLHRRALWTMLRQLPGWTSIHMEMSDDGWLTRTPDNIVWQDKYPDVGVWPPTPYPWQSRNRGAIEVGIKLPCWLRIAQRGWTGYEVYVPSDADHYISLLLMAKWATGKEAVWTRVKYRAWLRWVYHGEFNGQDQFMIERMQIPPERLYRPDVSITAWRRLCQEEARLGPAGQPESTAASPPAEVHSA